MAAPVLAVLRRPVWVAGAVLAVLAAALFVRLGMWQLDRHEERRAFNATLAAAAAEPAAPLADVRAAADPEYRLAAVAGEYVPGTTVLLQSRTYRGASGFHVLDALDTGDGPVLVVDRGWVPLALIEEPARLAPPPAGPVTVEGRVRLPRPSGAVSPARDGLPPRLGRVDPEALTGLWQRDVADLYLELISQEPPPGPGDPIPTDPPAPTAGPHMGYAFQWFAFAAIAVTGFVVLVHRTARRPPALEREAGQAPLG